MCSLVALGLIGTAVSAGGALMQGQQAQAMANAQAKAYEQQARADSQASAFERNQERKKQDLLAANARAQAGASGVALTGSPTEVLAANAREGELELGAIQYGSQLRQNQLRTQGAISRFSGRQARAASFISGADALVSGVGRAVKFGQTDAAFRRTDPWEGMR
jgi:hypothetical protein